MNFLVGLPTFVAGGAVLYVVAELESRALAITAAVAGLVWLWFAMRREARR